MKTLLRRLLFLLALAAASAGLWIAWVRFSGRPWATKSIPVPGLTAETRIERDKAGFIVIHAANTLDSVRALGFAHASDRFWQMDMRRRRALGTLAQVEGSAAVASDELAQAADFARLAGETLSLLPPDQRARLDAYAAGVNAGVASIGGRSARHRALGLSPAPWAAADSILVAQAMFLELQLGRWERDRRLGEIRDRLGTAWAEEFAGSATGPLPGPKILDVASLSSDEDRLPPPLAEEAAALEARDVHSERPDGRIPISDTSPGAVEGVWYGSPKTPSDWYFSETQIGSDRQVLWGLSWPGLPLLLIGSNGSVAWAVAPSERDVADVVLLPRSDIDPETLYGDGQTTLKVEQATATLRVAGAKDREVVLRRSKWGPIVGRGEKGQHLALRWTALFPEAIELSFARVEEATDAASASAALAHAALPPMAFAVSDLKGGRATGTLGLAPVRVGFDGRFPVYFAFRDRAWDRPAFRAESDPADSRIRESAAFGALLTQTLQGGSPAGIESQWRSLTEALHDTNASPVCQDAFARHLRSRVLGPILRKVTAVYEEFEYATTDANRVASRILEQRPAHLLDARYASWDEVVREAAAATAREIGAIKSRASGGLALANPAPQSIRALALAGTRRVQKPSSKTAAEAGATDRDAVLRFSVEPGALRFFAPGGPTDFPGSDASDAWTPAWLENAPSAPETRGDRQDAVLLTP